MHHSAHHQTFVSLQDAGEIVGGRPAVQEEGQPELFTQMELVLEESVGFAWKFTEFASVHLDNLGFCTLNTKSITQNRRTLNCGI